FLKEHGDRGRLSPDHIRFVTFTTRYPRSHWLTIDHLQQHYERAEVEARRLDAGRRYTLTTRNITRLTLAETTAARELTINGQALKVKPAPRLTLARTGDRWALARPVPGLHKTHALQGPIDDAFMDSFLVVLPGGPPMNEKVGAWVEAEAKRARREWRRHYRGDARQKTDEQVTDADLAAHHLVLWGDPQSNRLLGRIADRLPVRWTASGVQVGQQTYAADRHVPVLVFPNPLNPARYVVLNSGFTFREYDYLNNARQTPKLPDWAVVNLETPPNSRYPGAIVNAGFFDEGWRLK
ncbi:MAG: hypothetical protein ACKOET_07575, partial [Verrucomicrobiota bacterium]